MLPTPQIKDAMEQTSQCKHRGNIQLAWVIGAMVGAWYMAAMFVVLKP